MPAKVHHQPNVVTLRDEALFRPDQRHHLRRFAARALALREVSRLAIQPAAGEARMTYRVPPAGRKDFLLRLADAIGTESNPFDEAMLPPWPAEQAVTLSRVGEIITTLRVLDIQAGRLRVTHELLASSNESVAQRIQRTLQTLPGVEQVVVSGGRLTLRFDPSRIDAGSVMRAVEMQLAAESARAQAGKLPPVPFGIANATVGLGTAGELLLPLATPLAAGILVATHLNVLRDAAADLTRGKVGVPLFHTALLACSIATGQVLAYALTDWSLRFWQQRWRNQLADEARRLLEATLPLPELARVVMAGGEETIRPAALLATGDRIRVAAGEPIPADGRVTTGEALVDERLVSGTRSLQRKSPGAPVLGGSKLLIGALDIVVERAGSTTTVERIAGVLGAAVRVFPHDRALQGKSQQLAERTVLPTLATAGVGWVAGDLITVGAILHQDWISGPALAVPLLTLDRIRAALQHGVLVRNATAIPRLAESRFLVLDGDDPALAAPGLELAELQSRLPDADTVLRHAAGAALYLGDERAGALADACRDRGLIVRRPVLSALTADGVETCWGAHTIRLIGGPVNDVQPAPELLLAIDGHEVARLRFRTGVRPQASAAVECLRAAGIPTFIVSSASDTDAAELAGRLGADFSGGDLDPAGRIRFLRGLRRRGVRPVYVGNLAARPELAREAHVAVAAGGLDGHAIVGDLVLLGSCYGNLADLFALARGYDPAIVNASRRATLPNLLCIAGAFAGVLNGITAGILANVGVMNVDRRLQRTLSATRYRSEAGRSMVA